MSVAVDYGMIEVGSNRFDLGSVRRRIPRIGRHAFFLLECQRYLVRCSQPPAIAAVLAIPILVLLGGLPTDSFEIAAAEFVPRMKKAPPNRFGGAFDLANPGC